MKYGDDEQGKCVTCGFLSARPLTQTPAFPGYYEFGEHERSTGEVQLYIEGMNRRMEAKPACFRHVADLEGEATTFLRQQDDGITHHRARVEVISKDRKCADWYPYTAGFEPKEHWSKLESERLENQRRKFELELFQASRKIQEDSRQIAQRSFRFNLFFTLILILLTLVQIWLAFEQHAVSVPAWLEKILNFSHHDF